MRIRLVALILIFVAGCSDRVTEGPAELVSSIVLDLDYGFFGGLSGIELGPDGGEMLLLLDSGLLIHGLLHRDEAGHLTGLRQWHLVAMEEPADIDLGSRGLDVEGLAVTDAGTFVSLERIHAVWRISPTGDIEERLPQHPDFLRLGSNSSLEALAADADGALYVLPERSGRRSRPFPVWKYSDGSWSKAFEVPRNGRFLAVGADFGPDGRFYLLERRFLLPLGFATRVRRLDVEDGRVVSDEVLLETPLGMYDNLEGLAVWRDGDGAIRLTMVSDDNGSRFQETQIVEYRLPPELDSVAGSR